MVCQAMKVEPMLGRVLMAVSFLSARGASAVVAVAIFAAAPAWSQIPSGDVTGDGKLDTADVLILMRIAVGEIDPPTPLQLEQGDVAPLQGPPDGVVGIADLLLVLRAVGGDDVDGDGLFTSDELGVGASPFRLDSDGDTLSDAEEVALGTDPTSADPDGDGFPDAEDNCTAVANANQLDGDGDGFGNHCDVDFDNDGTLTGADLDFAICAGLPPAWTDLDGDGELDFLEIARFGAPLNDLGGSPGPSGVTTAPFTPNDFNADDDGDGVLNYKDTCRSVDSVYYDQAWDDDGDGFGRVCDPDYDDDGDVDQDDQDAFDAVVGAAGYDPQMDHDADGDVDAADRSLVEANFASGLPGPSGAICPEASPVPSTSGRRAYHWVLRGGEVVERAHILDHRDFELKDAPDCGSVPDCLTFDTDAETFRFVSDPDGTDRTTSFTYVYRDRVNGLVRTVQDVTLEFFDPAESSYGSNDLVPHALVIYNSNAAGAAEIAEHYRAARGLSAGQVCPVELPNGAYASKDEFLGARKQIVEDCLCPLIPAAERPPSCGSDPAALAAASAVTHLVIVRGMPARLFGTGLPGDQDEPAMDPLLAWLIYHDDEMLTCAGTPEFPECVFPLGYGAIHTYNQVVPFLYHTDEDEYIGLASSPRTEGRYLRGLEAGLDRFAAYGRLERMNIARTKDLVNETLAVESDGFQGNVVTERPLEFEKLREVTGSLANECVEYVDTPDLWPHTSCRTGTTYTNSEPNGSSVPGEVSSEIPVAYDVGLFLGGNYLGNSQRGFDGFGNMTRWQRSGGACTPLCRDHADPAACEAESSDYFGELASCVGGAPGLIGYQFRSYPVSYYGFYPSGWVAGTGNREMTPPEVRSDGASDGAQYLHLGRAGVGSHDVSQCTLADGSSTPCPEHVNTYMVAQEHMDPALEVEGDRTFTVTFDYRSQAGGPFDVILRVRDLDSSSTASKKETVILQATDAWVQTPVLSFTFDETEVPQIDRVDLTLRAGLAQGLKGFLDLDAVRIVDPVLGELLPAAKGSFEETTHEWTTQGDYASNALDRLGAIGWWGSSSHFQTGGGAFSKAMRTARGFFSGRSLGESVLLGGALGSGLVYGDPLYRPSAATLFFPSESDGRRHISHELNTVSFDPVVTMAAQEITPANAEMYRFLFMNVLHGTGNLATVNWEVATCTGPPGVPIAAEDCPQWSVKKAGTGSQRETRIDWIAELLDDPLQDQWVTVRLKVWNPGEEDQALFDFRYLDYRVNSP